MFNRVQARRRHRIVSPQAIWATLIFVLAAILIFAGYSIWTEPFGFGGRTVWDWLAYFALFLPTFIVLSRKIRVSRRRRTVRGRVIRATLIIALAAGLIFAGYTVLAPYSGFAHRTVWDWVNL